VTDPRRLRPIELCRLLNSTPLGEVINEQQLRGHRTRAGLRIGDSRHVDLIRYVAWLVQVRHARTPEPAGATQVLLEQEEAAKGAAALGSRREQMKGHGQKLTARQEALIAALLTEPTYAQAAAQAGVSEATMYRWLHLPDFRAAYRQARRELLETAIGRIQAATGQAVNALVTVTHQGRRDSDRVRAAVALLNQACRGLNDADILHRDQDAGNGQSMDTGDVVKLLAAQLQQVDQSELPTAEKARLTASLADTLLRAIGVDVLDKRSEALQAVLLARKEKKP